MGKAIDLITNALLDLGVLADGETPSASQAQGALRKLNNMLQAWNIEKLNIYGSTAYTLPLVDNKSVYTIGLGGDLNIPYPTEITNVSLRDITQPLPYRVDLPVYMYTDDEYAELVSKNLTGGLVTGVWLDSSYPLMNLTTNFVPNGANYNLILWITGLLGDLTLYQDVVFSPGYSRAIEANLAMELAGSYQVEPAATVVRAADMSAIRAKNLQVNTLKIDPRLAGNRFNMITGNC